VTSKETSTFLASAGLAIPDESAFAQPWLRILGPARFALSGCALLGFLCFGVVPLWLALALVIDIVVLPMVIGKWTSAKTAARPKATTSGGARRFLTFRLPPYSQAGNGEAENLLRDFRALEMLGCVASVEAGLIRGGRNSGDQRTHVCLLTLAGGSGEREALDASIQYQLWRRQADEVATDLLVVDYEALP